MMQLSDGISNAVHLLGVVAVGLVVTAGVLVYFLTRR